MAPNIPTRTLRDYVNSFPRVDDAQLVITPELTVGSSPISIDGVDAGTAITVNSDNTQKPIVSLDIASQEETEAGVVNDKGMTPLRTQQHYDKMRGSITFIAPSDGVTDVSVQWNVFLASCLALGVRGIIPAGRYYVPNAVAVSLNAKLVLRGEGQPVIDGGGTAANYALRLTNKGLRIYGVTFTNFTDVISAGDGSGGTMPNSLTGDVDEFVLDRVGFVNCRRPVSMIVAKTGPTLANLEITNCFVDGKTSGWTGFFCGWTSLLSAKVNGNIVRNINATAAGYGSGGAGAPLNTGTGRAIDIGGNNPAPGYSFARWEVNGNLIENVIDNRNKQAGSNPEVGGIRVTGARFVSICGNKLANIKSLGVGIDDDCEGIYPKASFSVISNNTLDDVGIGSASIIIKGYNRVQNTTDPDPGSNPSAWGFGGVCSGNTIRSTAGNNSGIAIYSSEWIVESNYIEGCGGDSSRLAAIWSNAAQNDNTVIRGNTLINSVGNTAIYMQSYGKNICIENNIIDGLANPSAGTTPGIYVNNTNGNGFNTGGVKLSDLTISGNKIGGITAQVGSLTRGITLASGGSNATRSRIMNNVLTSVVDTGIQIGNGTHEGVTIVGNDLRLAVDKYSAAGSPTVTDMAANYNAGWLYAETSINPASLAAGATTSIGTVAIDDCVTRDVVRVTSSSGLSGLILWGAVTATGTVTLYLFNPTAGAVDVPTSTFRVSVEKIAA